jgi:hypothetical protein
MDSGTLEQLLADARDYLQITWADEATDRRLTDMIQASAVYLDAVTASENDYISPGNMRTLLLERVRYQYNGALDAWMNNYLHLVVQAQLDAQSAALAAEKAAEEVAI